MPEQIQTRLEEENTKLRRLLRGNPVRWVRPQNIHLTLRFLGEVDPEGLESAREVMLQIVPAFGEFDLEARGFGCFPSFKRPRVLWVGVTDPSETLERLQASLERGLAGAGFSAEGRDFHPHLTLGRVRHGPSQAELRSLQSRLGSVEIGTIGEWKASEVVLFRSVLNPEGPLYTPLQKVALATGD